MFIISGISFIVAIFFFITGVIYSWESSIHNGFLFLIIAGLTFWAEYVFAPALEAATKKPKMQTTQEEEK